MNFVLKRLEDVGQLWQRWWPNCSCIHNARLPRSTADIARQNLPVFSGLVGAGEETKIVGGQTFDVFLIRTHKIIVGEKNFYILKVFVAIEYPFFIIIGDINSCFKISQKNLGNLHNQNRVTKQKTWIQRNPVEKEVPLWKLCNWI